MWKKTIVTLLTLITMFSVVYACREDIQPLQATASLTGGSLTGRIHQNPANLSIQDSGLRKGDRLLFGERELAWILMYKSTYEDYENSETVGSDGWPLTKPGNPSITGWLAMSSTSLGKMSLSDTAFETYTTDGGILGTMGYATSKAAVKIAELNTKLAQIDHFEDIVAPRNLSLPRTASTANSPSNGNVYSSKQEMFYTDEHGKKAFTPGFWSLTRLADNQKDAFETPRADFAFSDDYWSTDYALKLGYWYLFKANGTLLWNGSTYTTPRELRPAIWLNLEDIVFALSKPDLPGMASISSVKLPAAYTSLYEESMKYDAMKVRMENSTLSATTHLTQIENKKGDTIQQTVQGSTIYLRADAKAGSDGKGGVNTVSVLVFDDQNQFVYYQPLEAAKGSGLYEFDTSKMATGSYSIGIVNEVYDPNRTDPADCSRITDVIPLKVLDPLSDLTVDPLHGDTAGDLEDVYQAVDSGAYATADLSQIATITSKNGVGNATVNGNFENGISYTVIESSDSDHAGDENLFKVALDGNKKPLLTADQHAYILPKLTGTQKHLKPGAYKYRIQAVDQNGDPFLIDSDQVHITYPIDKNGNAITSNISVEKGLISEDLLTVVYPSPAMVQYTQALNNDRYYTLKEINEQDLSLGTIQFSSDAQLAQLLKDGYSIKEIQIVEKGTMTPITDLQVVKDASDVSGNTYVIKKKGTVQKGSRSFDLLIRFKDQSHQESGTIRKSNLTFTIPDPLQYVDMNDTNSFLTGSAFVLEYDPETSSNNQYMLYATDHTSSTNVNTNVEYCVLLGDKSACDMSSDKDNILQLSYANGTASILAKGPGTTMKSITVRAFTKDQNGIILAQNDLEVKVYPKKQILKWQGSDIQKTGNDITSAAGTDQHPTWSVQLQYDAVTAANNVYELEELFQKQVPSAGKLGLVTNVTSDSVSLDIQYDVQLSSVDQGKITLDPVTKKLTIHSALTNDAKLVATAQGVGNYAPTVNQDDPSTTSINEDGSATLVLNISAKPHVVFTSDPFFQANTTKTTSDFAIGSASFGKLALDKTGESIDGFTIDLYEIYDENTDQWNTSNAADFKIAGTKKNELYAAGAIPKGTYRITISAYKGNTMVSTQKLVEITVINDTFDVTKIKWQKQTEEETNYTDIGGSIRASDQTNSKTFEIAYGQDASFYLQIQEKETDYLKNTTITYATKTIADEDVVTLHDHKATMKKAGTAYVKATIEKTGYDPLTIFLPVEIKKGVANILFTDKDGDPLAQNGAVLGKNQNGMYEPYTHVYEKEGLLDIFTSNIPKDTGITIKITSTAQTSASHPDANDVLGFATADSYVSDNLDSADKICKIPKEDVSSMHLEACQVTILNALYNKNDQIQIQAITEESDNYKSSTITLPVIITKADQDDFAFQQREFSVLPDKNGMFQPSFVHKYSTGKIQLSTIPKNGTADLSADKAGVKAGNDDTFVNKKDTVWYNIPLKEGDEPVLFHVYAQDLGDRNYNASDEVSMRVKIDPEAGSKYDITLENEQGMPLVTYGDASFTLQAYSIKDETEPNVTYTYELVDDANLYIEKIAGEHNAFKPLKAGENITVKITRTNTDTGVVEPSMLYTFSIYKKKLELQVSPIEKKLGQAVTKEDYTFTTTPEFVAGDETLIEDVRFHCKRGNQDIVDLPYVLLEDDGLAITASFEESAEHKEQMKNYEITIHPGSLSVTADTSDTSWYEIVGREREDGTFSVAGDDGWYNGPVDIRLKQGTTSSYDTIGPSLSEEFGSFFPFVKEGIHQVDIYFQNASTKATTQPRTDTIKIDQTKPNIRNIDGTAVTRNTLEEIVHNLSFGIFFKPGVEVQIKAEDLHPKNDTSTEISGIKEIHYNVYLVDKDYHILPDVYAQDTVATSDSISFVLPDSGKYYVEASAMDHAGNVSEQKGSYLDVRKIDVDVDKDGNPDFNDPDEDGCADFNIVFKDEDGNWGILNEDKDRDGIPERNIDTDGDGVADLNIDTDQDGLPDLNLVNMKEDPSLWKPTQCVFQHGEYYASKMEIEPQINVDVHGEKDGDSPDQIADLNIDLNGDMKADINITDKNNQPYINIYPLHEWNPEPVFTYQGFTYDTISLDLESIILLNRDTDQDGRPDVNLDLNNDGIPELNIDTDNDGIPDIQIDTDGDGKADINLDTNGDGKADEKVYALHEWKPMKDAEHGIPYDTMDLQNHDELEDQGIIIQKPGGGFLPNFSIKVDNITETEKENVKNLSDDEEVKIVYDVKLLKDGVQTQPDGTVTLKIPIPNDVKNPKLLVRNAKGEYESVDATIENGYFIYQCDDVNYVSVVGEREEPVTEPSDPVDDPVQKQNSGSETKPATSVKGTYTKNPQGGIGGALTGDTHSLADLLAVGSLSAVFCVILWKRKKRNSI